MHNAESKHHPSRHSFKRTSAILMVFWKGLLATDPIWVEAYDVSFGKHSWMFLMRPSSNTTCRSCELYEYVWLYNASTNLIFKMALAWAKSSSFLPSLYSKWLLNQYSTSRCLVHMTRQKKWEWIRIRMVRVVVWCMLYAAYCSMNPAQN